MAEIRLYVGEDQVLPSSSGLGFYGNNGFADPVAVGDFNGRTFVTNVGGDTEGFECNNNKRTDVSGLILGQVGSGILLTQLPNRLGTVNVRFTHASAVKTLSAILQVYDGSVDGNGDPNKDNDPIGLSFYTAQIRHQSDVQDNTGLGDSEWTDTKGATSLSLVASPGISGLRPSGPDTTDVRHDWYVAMSTTPNELGDKLFGMYVELEFV